jgi:hypothetical protein
MMEGPEVEALVRALVTNFEAGVAVERPFFHLEFDQVFPDDIYAEMISAMPSNVDYRAEPGHRNGNLLPDGRSTRVKIDLFPEYVRQLNESKFRIWDVVGRALRSREVQAVFMRRLAPGLKRRFGDASGEIDLYPIPILTRDIPGYRIYPHVDSRWKGITVQLYLPRDEAATHIGTIFHDRLPDGRLTKASQMKFAPNTGYAFAVGEDTWHSADPVGAEVDTRDSILLTYYVDSGLLRILRNRSKRVGNLVLNKVKHLARRQGSAARA